MPNPNVKLKIQDPGLGIIQAGAGRTQAKFGASQAGVPNSISAFGTKAAAQTLGSGPLLNSLAQVLDVAGGPVVAVPVLVSSYGTVVGSLSLTGVGTGTIAGGKGPEQIVKIKIGTGGALGTATFQSAVGAGAYGAAVTTGASGPWSYPVPGQSFTTAVFAAGTYVSGDVYTLNLDGTVTRTGSGTATLLNGSTHSPTDAYNLWVKVMTTGGLGVGSFAYSLDGGNSYSGTIAIPSSGTFVVPGAGIVLTFSGTFSQDDIYKGTSTAPGFSNSDLTTAMQALLASPTSWGFAHVVGTPANAAAAVTLAAVVGAQMAAAEVADRYKFGIVECPQDEGDAALKAAAASYVDPRVAIVAGDIQLLSPLTGRLERRNLAWAYSARLSAIKLSAHPGQTDPSDNGGALKNVRSAYRDEDATPGLDDARFVTAMTFSDFPGYYITRGRMMAAPGSDFAEVMNRRVMDQACATSRAAFLLYINKAIRVDPDTGFIEELSAQKIEAVVGAKLHDTLVTPDEASGTSVTVSREDNLLSTSTLSAEVAIIPKGYSEFITVNIGFQNPAIGSGA